MTRKRISIILAIVSVLLIVTGSFAIYTDRETSEAYSDAGNIDLKITPITVSKTNALYPGDGVAITYTLTNSGSISTDIKEKLIISLTPKAGSEVALNSSNPEFKLYQASDVTIDSTGLAKIKSGAKPVSKYLSKSQICYEGSEFILNGTGLFKQTEVGGLDSKATSFVLVFESGASLDFQGVTLTVDYEAQGKQHRNTDSNTWDEIMSEKVTFAGNANYATVPDAK